MPCLAAKFMWNIHKFSLEVLDKKPSEKQAGFCIQDISQVVLNTRATNVRKAVSVLYGI